MFLCCNYPLADDCLFCKHVLVQKALKQGILYTASHEEDSKANTSGNNLKTPLQQYLLYM